jgi:hypothetical protein
MVIANSMRKAKDEMDILSFRFAVVVVLVSGA